MSERIDQHSVVELVQSHRLQWEEAQQAHVLLYPEGMVTLNHSAGEILKRCNGERTVADVIAELQAVYPDAPVATDAMEFLTTARDHGWLRVR